MYASCSGERKKKLMEVRQKGEEKKRREENLPRGKTAKRLTFLFRARQKEISKKLEAHRQKSGKNGERKMVLGDFKNQRPPSKIILSERNLKRAPSARQEGGKK